MRIEFERLSVDIGHGLRAEEREGRRSAEDPRRARVLCVSFGAGVDVLTLFSPELEREATEADLAALLDEWAGPEPDPGGGPPSRWAVPFRTEHFERGLFWQVDVIDRHVRVWSLATRGVLAVAQHFWGFRTDLDSDAKFDAIVASIRPLRAGDGGAA